MKNTGCSLLLALLLCGCAASPAVVPFHYDNGPDYVREGLYRIVDDRGRMGYADESGRVVIAPRFAFALPFEDGKAKVKGLYSERTGKTYDGTVLLCDTGEKYVNYRIEQRK